MKAEGQGAVRLQLFPTKASEPRGSSLKGIYVPWWADCSSHSAKCLTGYLQQPQVGKLRCPHPGPGIQTQTEKQQQSMTIQDGKKDFLKAALA